MEGYYVHWEPVKLTQLSEEFNAQFYLLEKEGVIFYIGYIEKDKIIPQSLYEAGFAIDLDAPLEQFTLWLGKIIRNIHTFVTPQLIREIHCLEVYKHQPLYNQFCKDRFTGRKDLMIQNRGCDFLERTVRYTEPANSGC